MNASYLLVEPVGGLYRIATSGGAIEVSEQELRWLCLVAGPAALPPLPSPAEKSRRQSEAGDSGRRAAPAVPGAIAVGGGRDEEQQRAEDDQDDADDRA